MTSEAMTQTAAAQELWQAVREFLKATAADDTTDPLLLVRMARATELGVMVQHSPTPRIGIAGADAAGRFAQTFELRDVRGLN